MRLPPRFVKRRQKNGTNAKTIISDGPTAFSSTSINKIPLNSTRSAPNFSSMIPGDNTFYYSGPDSRMFHKRPNKSHDRSYDGTSSISYESNGSYDSMVCAKAGMCMGRAIGNTVNAFVTGLTEVLDYKENVCKGTNLCQEVHDDIPLNTIITNGENKGLPSNVVAITVHSGSRNEDSLNDGTDVKRVIGNTADTFLTGLTGVVNYGENLFKYPTQWQHQGDDKRIHINLVSATPPPDSQNEDCLNAKNNELLDLLKEDEATLSHGEPSAESVELVLKIPAEVEIMTTGLKFNLTVDDMNDSIILILTEKNASATEKTMTEEGELALEINLKRQLISELEQKRDGAVKKASSGDPPLEGFEASLDSNKENEYTINTDNGAVENEMASKKSDQQVFRVYPASSDANKENKAPTNTGNDPADDRMATKKYKSIFL